jgi:hypothetical protein
METTFDKFINNDMLCLLERRQASQHHFALTNKPAKNACLQSPQ